MKWSLNKPDLSKIADIMESQNISKEVATIVEKFGLSDRIDLETFLYPHFENFHDPFIMKGMKKSVERIFKTISLGQKIFVLGDSDADGISAAALLYNGIKFFGGNVKVYIPNRNKEGRGLLNSHIDKAFNYCSDILITCDCGMNSYDSIEYANKKNIDVIVTDHHLLNDKPVNAFSILNPNQSSCKYPFKDLSGSGVALKLFQGMIKYKKLNIEISKPGIILATLGTLSDMVPLTDENRLIVYFGLKNLPKTKDIGLKVLLKKIKSRDPFYVSDLSRYVIPQINSTSRVGDSNKVFDLLTIREEQKAKILSLELEVNNRKRLDVQKKILFEIHQTIKNNINLDKDRVIVCFSSSWEYGVLGLVASKLRDYFKRPVLLISFKNSINGRGSFRSVKGFNLVEVLSHFKSYLISFGGHRMASGLEIDKLNLNSFKRSLLVYAGLKMKDHKVDKSLYVDLEVKLSCINSNLLSFLKKLEPYGLKNTKPQFMVRNIRVIGNPDLISSGEHIRFIVKQDKKSINAIGYGLANLYEMLTMGALLDIIFVVESNRRNQKEIVQLNIKDIRLSAMHFNVN